MYDNLQFVLNETWGILLFSDLYYKRHSSTYVVPICRISVEHWENTGIFCSNNPTVKFMVAVYRLATSTSSSSNESKSRRLSPQAELIEMKLNPNKTSSRRKMRKAHLSASSSERRERMVCGLSKDQFTKYHVCSRQLLSPIIIK